MDLASVTNAPRALTLNGQTLRARTLTLGQIGELLTWLKDRLPDDDLRFSSEASRLALATTEGLSVLLHLSLLSCHPGLSRDEARGLAATMGEDDAIRLHLIAFRRLPGKPADPDAPPPKDLALVNWGEIFEALSGHKPEKYAGVAGLTLDQFDNWANKGEGHDKDALDPRDVQAMWEAAQAKDEASDAV